MVVWRLKAIKQLAGWITLNNRMTKKVTSNTTLRRGSSRPNSILTCRRPDRHGIHIGVPFLSHALGEKTTGLRIDTLNQGENCAKIAMKTM